MKKENFYIVIKNYRSNDDQNSYNFHVENIFSKTQALSILQDEERECYYGEESTDFQPRISDLVIVTDDLELLFRYICSINVNELNLLCGSKDFNNNRVRINKAVFGQYRNGKELLLYFNKILNKEIVSASTSQEHSYKIIPQESYNLYIKSYMVSPQWVENEEFEYFHTPIRYRKDASVESVFDFQVIREATLNKLNSIFKCNIIEIGEGQDESINWEFRNGLLRYYDKTSKKRLYATREILDEARKNRKVVFKVETKLDSNLYIEYYLQGLLEEEEYEDDDNGDRDDDRDANDWRRDTFNALTGGQLGDYDNFDGDMDSLDTWARG